MNEFFWLGGSSDDFEKKKQNSSNFAHLQLYPLWTGMTTQRHGNKFQVPCPKFT
jgi:hypothetical protein